NGGAFWYHDRNKNAVEKMVGKFLHNKKPNLRVFDYFRASGVPFINTHLGYWLLRPVIDNYQRGRESRRSIAYNTTEFDSVISDFEAALCHRQLSRYHQVYQRRKINYQIYKDELKNLVKFPFQPPEFDPDYLYAPILVEQQVRAQLLNKFQNTLVSDINFAYINKLEVLKEFSFNTPNRLGVQDEYLLLTLHHSEKITRKIVRHLKLAIIKFNKHQPKTKKR
ncbi:MAG: DegT/DnrJ/EryC1/StrS family aminotransferase, partial [bacterium]|nr:DegT/DnrJ/EryC1/StrS family aminotransferase [bacterium]